MPAKKDLSRSTLTDRERDKLYVQDIIDNCNKIKTLIKGLTYEKFIASSDKNERIAFRTQQIGEAASTISKELKQEFSDINWRELSLLRNLIVHA